MDYTASQLADALDDVHNSPHNTNALAMLDEATRGYRVISPELAAAQVDFALARELHKTTAREGYSDEAWETAMAAASILAALLRELGDVAIARCTRHASWGTCNLPLDLDGQCPGADHTD